MMEITLVVASPVLGYGFCRISRRVVVAAGEQRCDPRKRVPPAPPRDNVEDERYRERGKHAEEHRQRDHQQGVLVVRSEASALRLNYRASVGPGLAAP